jgi:putative transposase
LAFSLVSVHARRAFPVRVEPVMRSAAEKAASTAKAAAKQQKPSTPSRRPGRPKGSRHTPTADVPLTPEWSRITAMLEALLTLIAGMIPLTSLGLDGHFGHHHALHMARQSHLHLISKLRCDAALYFPDAGPYAGRGPRRTYGSKVDDGNMPAKSLTETAVEGHIKTRVYQAPLLHKAFAQPLHVVLITKLNRRTQAQAHVGHRQGFWSKTHGCVVQECCRALPSLLDQATSRARSTHRTSYRHHGRRGVY